MVIARVRGQLLAAYRTAPFRKDFACPLYHKSLTTGNPSEQRGWMTAKDITHKSLERLMANRKPYSIKRRPRGKYLNGPVDEDLALGTLAAKTGITQIFGSVVNEAMRVSSVSIRYALSNFTLIAGAGPILVGIAHSDYTLSEIEEFLEQTAGWNVGDRIAQERAGRLIRRIGIFEGPDADGDAVALNDGKPIKTKLNWLLATGQSLQVFGYNLGEQSLATTNPNINLQGKANLWLQ